MKSIALLFLLSCSTFLFGQDHHWTKSSSRHGFTEPIYKTAIDASDNIYLVSNYKDTIDVDPSANYSEAVTNGGSNVLIEKISPAGDLIWVKTIEGDNTYGMSVTINGNDLFVTGFFNGTVDFNLDVVTEEQRIAALTNALFVLKLDLDGNYQDVFITQMSIRAAMSYLGDQNYGATTKIDSQGNILTTGSTLLGPFSSYDIDPSANVEDVFPTGIADGFIQKISNTGDLIWGFLLGGGNVEFNGMEGICGLQIDSLDNIYVAGKYSATTNFNPRGTSEMLTTTDIFNTTGYIARYTPNGILDWVSGLTYGSRTTNLSLKDTSLYVTGDFSEVTVFGGTIPIFPNGINTYLMKMSLDGAAIWVEKFDTTGNGLLINSTLVDNNGNLCVVASQRDSVDYDFSQNSSYLSQGTVGKRSSTLIRYNPNGELISVDGWINQQGENNVYSIAIDAQNSIICAGDYKGVTDFDIETGVLSITSSVQRDWFISKYTFTDLELIVSPIPSDSIGMCNGLVNYYTLNAIGPVSYSIQGQPNWQDFSDTLCDGYYIMVAIDSVGRSDTTGFSIYVSDYYNFVDTSNIFNGTPFDFMIDDCAFDFFTEIDSAFLFLDIVGIDEYALNLSVHQNGSVYIYEDTIYADLSQFGFMDITIYCSDSMKAALKLNRLLLNINYGIAGVEENVLQNLSVYPNPFSNLFYVKFPDDLDLSFDITDNLGRIIQFEANNTQHGVEFRIPNASNGVFFLIVRKKDSLERRVIKLIQNN